MQSREEIVLRMTPEVSCADWNHPAWDVFVSEMSGNQYGHEALWDAWRWFRAGWECAKECL